MHSQARMLVDISLEISTVWKREPAKIGSIYKVQRHNIKFHQVSGISCFWILPFFCTRLYTSFQFISAKVVLQKGYLHISRDIYHTQGNNKNCFHSHKRLRKENMAQTVSWLFSKWGKRLTLKGILQGEQISFTENRFGRRPTRSSTSQSQNFNSQLLRQILRKR